MKIAGGMVFALQRMASLPLATVWLLLVATLPALAQQEPELASEQPQFPSETVPLYRVERTKTLLVTTQGRARVLILNPEAVEVVSVTDSYVTFLGLKLDSSVVHLFDSSGRHTIRIEVTELTSIVTEMEQRNKEAVREKLGISKRSLKVRYRGTQRNLQRGDAVSISGTHEQDRIRTQELTAEMGVPWGDLRGKMILEQRRDEILEKEITEPRHLSAELRRVPLGPLGPSEFVAGDRDLDLSRYTIEGRRYRGLGMFPFRPFSYYGENIQKPDREIALSLFGGEERQGYGLDLPAGLQSRDARSHFTGARAEYALWETGSVHLTGLHRYGKGGELRSANVFAAGLEGTVADDRLQVKGEAARNGPEGAYELETRARLTDWLKMRNRFWQVGKQYRSVTGPVADDGQTGWKGRLNADLTVLERPLAPFVEATIFRDRNALNPAKPRDLNTIYTVGASTLLPGKVSFEGSGTYENENGSPLPYVNRRFDLDLRREIELKKKWIYSLSPFVGYRYSLYEKSNNVPGFDAKLALYRTGVQASFPEGLWGTVSWSEGRLKEKHPESGPAVSRPKEFVFEVGKTHNFKIVPASLNLSFRLEEVQQTFNKTHQPFADRDRVSGDGRFTWRLGPEREAFAELSLTRQKPVTGSGGPLVDIFAQFGVQLLWDAGWAPAQTGRIAGELFKDLDGNGVRGPEEPGLGGVRIYVEGGKETRTRGDGRYTLRGVPEGPAVVHVDAKGIPRGYFFTTPNSRQILVVPGKEMKADFGVSTESEFRGVVFNDLNEDGQYQEGTDRPVPGVRMMVESGQSASSDAGGFYSIRKVIPGEHTLSVDVGSIPDGYRTLVPVQKVFQTAEGEVVRYDLSLKAQRSVWGSVYVDADGNGARGSSEKGIPGIRLRLDGQKVVTDSNGAYRFADVQPGRYVVRVDPAGLPAGYRLASSEPVTLEVPEGPFTREHFDFAVIPVDGPAPQSKPQSAARPGQESASEGEFTIEEFRKRFPGVSVPEGTRKVYLLSAGREATVYVYTHETLLSTMQELASRTTGLPEGIRLQVAPFPSAAVHLNRPTLIVKDWMLDLPEVPADLPVAELTMGEAAPPLPGLVLQALLGRPGKRETQQVRGTATVRDAAGKSYWVWFI